MSGDKKDIMGFIWLKNVDLSIQQNWNNLDFSFTIFQISSTFCNVLQERGYFL